MAQKTEDAGRPSSNPARQGIAARSLDPPIARRDREFAYANANA